MNDMVGLVKIDEDNQVIFTNYGADHVKNNMHFVVLRYVGDLDDAKKTFKRICYRYDLGETWFMRGTSCADSSLSYIVSASFRPFPWSRYRKILFDRGIDRDFRSVCLKNRCGHIDRKEVKDKIFVCRAKRSRFNMTLQQSLSALLFR